MTSETNEPAQNTNGAATAVENADIKVGRALASKRNHPVIQWCCGVGEVGDQGPLYLIGASMVAVGLFRKSPRSLVTGVSLLMAVGVSDVAKSTVKRFVKRSRPHDLLDDGNYRFETGGSPEKKEQSFPSGHVAGAVAAAGTISRFYPTAGPYVKSAAAVITLSRIVKGKHWPLDLAAGFVIGIVSDQVVKKLTTVIFGKR